MRDDLPPALAEIEDLLASRPLPDESADFRERVLGAVRGELAASPGTARAPWDWWQAAWVSAAGILLWLNLSLAFAQRTSLPRPTGARADLEDVEAWPGLPLAGLPKGELKRQALLLRSGAVGFPPAPFSPGAMLWSAQAQADGSEGSPSWP